MRRIVALLVACSSSPQGQLDARMPDACVVGTPLSCDPLAQTGCNTGEKCTWVVDSALASGGHLGCLADGTIAIGDGCTFHDVPGECGTTGSVDNCIKGAYCSDSGMCEQICDPNGGPPKCAMPAATCTAHDGVFGEVGQPASAGLCDF